MHPGLRVRMELSGKRSLRGSSYVRNKPVRRSAFELVQPLISLRPIVRTWTLRMFNLVVLLLLVLGSAAPDQWVQAQEDQDEEAKGWYGTITYSMNEHTVTQADVSGGSSTGGDNNNEGGIRGLYYTEEEDTTVEVVVQIVDGKATASVRYQHDFTYKKGEAVSAPMEEASLLCPPGGMEFVMTNEARSNVNAQGTVPAYLTVELDPGGEYNVSVDIQEEVNGTSTNSETASCTGKCCPEIDPSQPSTSDSPYLAEGIGLEGTVEPGAKVLTGSQSDSLDNTEENANGTLVSGRQVTTGSRTLTWNLHRDDVELVVEPVGYEGWMPRGARDGGVANDGRLEVVARLQTSGGGQTGVRASKITFELLEVSREPGVAMNWPVADLADTDLDLAFVPELLEVNPGLVISEPDGQQAVTPAGEHNEATALIASYDWGAYGILRVTATLPNDRQLVGYLKGDRSMTDIRLPKRDADSHIADAWKRRHDLSGLRDGMDPEEQPKGDGFLGDGLTFYEEYRGFYEGGRHIRGNPRKKELFVRNELGGGAVPGIKVFAKATGLVVHYKLTADEMPDDQVINFNYSPGPRHIVNQHGLVMQYNFDPKLREQGFGGYVLAVGPPGKSQKVIITRQLDPSNSNDSSTVAHELGHAVNISHHGHTDARYVEWRQGSVNGTPVVLERRSNAVGTPVSGASGNPIKVYDEENVEIKPSEFGTPQIVYLAGYQGEHSGNQSCFMRYSVAWANIRNSDATGQSRYETYHDGEMEYGLGLCSTKQGTGVNAPNREPQSRYGDAHGGDCEHQIRVSDAPARNP
jgi:hypothetical protein